MSVCYKIKLDPAQHIYDVTLNFVATSESMHLSLPVWIPGSYMVREFSRNIIQVLAIQDGEIASCTQINKNTWQLDNLRCDSTVSIKYQVYAYEYGIRSAFLDSTRGYFNPTSLCLAVKGFESEVHMIEIAGLPHGWQVTCALVSKAANLFIAANYDELLDMPFELGTFERYEFSVAGVAHYLILSGTILPFDKKRMISDMTKICQYQVEMFGGVAPYASYTFILNLSGSVYTGLEHRNSTLLMAPITALPNVHGTNDDDYHKLLGLISHEFFHTWNVKRIKPRAFTPYDTAQENYTQLLWWFEGVTSYYDDLVLYRCGIISQDKYLGLIVDNLNNVYKFAGVTQQSLVNSSLTAWIKYYRQDENSPNTLVSYYVKGALVAMCLDLLIRNQSKHSLDDVMRYLYQQWQLNPIGIAEDEIPALIYAATGVDVSGFIQDATTTTLPILFDEILINYGLRIVKSSAKNHQDNGKYMLDSLIDKQITNFDLGAKLEQLSVGYVVKNVYNNTAAQEAGLAAQDVLLAINDIKITNLDKQLSFFNEGDVIELSLFRQDHLLSVPITVRKSTVTILNLQLEDSSLLARWL